MAELIKAKFWSRQRLDLPDFTNIQSFVETDFKQRNIFLLGGGNTPWIVRGFRVRPALSGLPGYVDVELAGSVLFNLTDPSDLQGIMFVGESSLAWELDVPVGTGVVTKYIHVKIDRTTTIPATRTFWDPSENAGLGGETQAIVDTVEIKEASFVITDGTPSADPSHILLAQYDWATGAPAPTSFKDERNMFFRLGKNDLYTGVGSFTTATFSPAGGGVGNDMLTSGGYTQSSNKTYTLTIDSVIGVADTFTWDDGGVPVTGVPITGLAQYLSYGGYVTFGATTGHILGDSWTWTGVAATGTAYTYNLGSAVEPGTESVVTGSFTPSIWTGGDKELDNLKEWMDFVMSQIKQIKFGSSTTGSSWFVPAPTNLSSFGTSLSGGGILTWTCPVPAASGTLTFTSDFIILLPGTAFSNYIRLADYPAGITLPFNDWVAYVDINKGASADLTVYAVDSAAYVSSPDRAIVAKRVADAIYVGI